MKKGSFLRNVLDTIRSNQANQSGGSGSSNGSNSTRGFFNSDFGGQSKAQHFSLAQVSQHGFPAQPTALAFDPVQKIAAIGTKTGVLRVFGRPGVDCWVQHKPEYAITHIKFIINQGALITVTSDESIHLWSLRGQNLKLNLSSTSSAQLVTPSPSPNPPTAYSQQQQQQSIDQQQQATSSSNITPSTNIPINSTTTIDPNHRASLNYQVGSNLDNLSQHSGDFGLDYLQDSRLFKQTNKQNATTTSTASLSGNENEQLLVSSKQLVKVHTLKFQREHITCLHQTLMSKWLYIGTEKGNIHVANVETFELSGYSIAWNKAIELSRKTHPGSVIHISECPQDSNKLLIGYESGCIVLWDLKNRNADGRYYYTENLLSLSWHYEGKQFVASHADGSLITWQTRSNVRPLQVLCPHAKSAVQQQQQQQQQQNMSMFETQSSNEFQGQQTNTTNLARALNNELYRPINKVVWKTSKNNEQFLLFSGGLPYDGIEQQPLNEFKNRQSTLKSPITQQQQQQQKLRTLPINPSPTAGGCLERTTTPTTTTTTIKQQPPQKRNLKSTSLTIMFGKSITVLEMDFTIIDFVTISDSSPYENDTSDPFAVIVLLADDLILIDLTSSGYPSFDSPYPAKNFNESPVTYLKYLADCSNELIPLLYSSSHNSSNIMSSSSSSSASSSAQHQLKRGFSDKEWPINGGEWGQSLQSYPELVITGHADGSIKFWDMSGVNFDIISKLKTSKLFNKPNKLENCEIIAFSSMTNKNNNNNNSNQTTTRSQRQSSVASLAFNTATTTTTSDASSTFGISGDNDSLDQRQQQQQELLSDDNFFAIEKIEYDNASKRLLVAGAMSQVIQFKLVKNKNKEQSCSEMSTIFIDPPTMKLTKNGKQEMISRQQAVVDGSEMNQFSKLSTTRKQHHLLEPKNNKHPTRSSNSSFGQNGTKNSAFKAEIICLTPLSINKTTEIMQQQQQQVNSNAPPIYRCYAPPKVTALAFQATHNILAYSDESGIVLVDIIQKSVILSATLSDLYSSNVASIGQNRADISIQPFATNSILQHHYKSNANPLSTTAPTALDQSQIATKQPSSSILNQTTPLNNDTTTTADNTSGGGGGENAKLRNSDGGSLGNININNAVLPLHKMNASGAESTTQSTYSNNDIQQAKQSRFTTNSMFQRQLSTTALGNPKRSPTSSSHRLFQRQATASQITAPSSSSTGAPTSSLTGSPLPVQQLKQTKDGFTNNQRVSSLANASASDSTNSAAIIKGATNSSSIIRRLPTQTDTLVDTESSITAKKVSEEQQKQQKKMAKNKRIISRMLSISAIHTTVTGGGSSSNSIIGASNNSSPAHIANNNSSLIRGVISNTTSNDLNNNTASLDNASKTTTTTTNDLIRQQPDKIDSSFARSRSSSGSSTTANAANFLGGSASSQQQQQQQQNQLCSNSGETVLCICFLDPTNVNCSNSAMSQASCNNNNNISAATAQSNSFASIDGSSSTRTMVASPANNYKSLSSIDSANKPSQLALYLGTSHGYVLQVSLTMPDNEDNRILQLQSVNAELIPQATIKLPGGAILCLTSFIAEGTARQPTGTMPPSSGSIGNPYSSFPSSFEMMNEGTGSPSQAGPLTGSGPSNVMTQRSQDFSSSSLSQQESRITTFLTIVSEKQAQVFLVPNNSLLSSATTTTTTPTSTTTTMASNETIAKSLPSSSSSSLSSNQLYAKINLTESSFVCRSRVVLMRSPEEHCLVSYLANGNLLVHSLPKLQTLMDEDFVPYSSERISSSMCFSKNGHCLYQPSESEICKFTISSQYKMLINDMLGSLYVPKDMPEMPRGNFFKTLFSVSVNKQNDRDELFGENSAGKPQRGVAKHFSATSTTTTTAAAAGVGLSAMDKLKGAVVGSMGHDLRVAREGLDERGEKLSEIEDRTLQMFNQSEAYSQAAHQLAQKFKDKKWYQF